MRRADAVCAAYATRVRPAARPRTYDAIVAYVKRTLPYYEAGLRKLEALRPPAHDAADVRSWLDDDRRVAAALRALGVAAERRDYPSVRAAAARIDAAGRDGSRTAARLGLAVCGRGGGATGR